MVPPSLIYGGEGWALFRIIVIRLRRAEGHYLGSMLRLRRGDSESLAQLLKRKTRTARTRWANLGFKLVDERLLPSFFKFVLRSLELEQLGHDR